MPALSKDDDTDELLERTSWGDETARDRLFERHRARLRTMIAVRLDRRLQARVDPSDVVQDVLKEATRTLDAYIKDRPVPVHVWLREIAWKRMVDLRRRHITAKRRSVLREQQFDLGLSDESAAALVNFVVASGTSPSNNLMQEELRPRHGDAQSAAPARPRSSDPAPPRAAFAHGNRRSARNHQRRGRNPPYPGLDPDS